MGDGESAHGEERGALGDLRPHAGVKEYRATIPRYVNPGDTVLEVGVAWGTTTAILARYARKVVGIDPGRSLATAVRTYPHVQFEAIEGMCRPP